MWETVLAAAFVAFGFPPFPSPEGELREQSLEEIERMAENGDGYAALTRAEIPCAAEDDACAATRSHFYELAIAAGYSAAEASQRIFLLERDPSRATEFAIGESVCGRKRADLEAIVQEITAIASPLGRAWGRGGLGSATEWETGETTDGDDHTVAIGRGAIGVILGFTGDDLKLARVASNLQVVGDDGQSIGIANSAIARAICPTWPGLEVATFAYLAAASVTWPPQGVDVDGPSVRLAVFGVVPDAVWYELYVDPFYDPFRSSFGLSYAYQSGLELPPSARPQR